MLAPRLNGILLPEPRRQEEFLSPASLCAVNSWIVSPALAISLALFFFGTSAAEIHWNSPNRNCFVDEAAPLLSPTTNFIEALPSRGGWYLPDGRSIVYVEAESLVSLGLESRKKTIIGPKIPISSLVRATRDSAAFYVVSVPMASGPSFSITIEAYSTETYRTLWSREIKEGPAFGPILPLAAGGRLILAFSDQLVALNPATGERAWTRKFNYVLGPSLAAEGDIAVLPTAEGVEAFALSTGDTLWKYPLASAVHQFAKFTAIRDGRVYLPVSKRDITVIELSSGRLIWQARIPQGEIDARHPVVLTAAGAIVPLMSGLAFIDPNGKVLWAKEYDFLNLRQMAPSLLAFQDSILIGGRDALVGISLRDGAVLWKKEGTGEVASIEHFPPHLAVINSLGKIREYGP